MVIKTELINNEIKKGEKSFIEKSEFSAYKGLENAAKKICEKAEEKPFILISGPSGSGKTTTAIKLYQIIKGLGHNVCYISMDKYFKNFSPEEHQLKMQNKIDLESPERVDSDFINSQLTDLLNNKEIQVPKYDFSTNKRSFTDKTLSRNGGFVIVEGIHALNPDVLGENDDQSTKIYVSVRSRIVDKDGDKLHPCKIRLMRRMMRDKLYRGRPIEETIKMFPSVQHGENKYILPYKTRSDIDIDTFIPYEANIYRSVLFEEIESLSAKYADVRDIVSGIDELLPIETDSIPSDALIREFIGGSTLNY